MNIIPGNSDITAAPLQNHGLGHAFSSTDTVATALANNFVMGLKAENLDWDFEYSGPGVKDCIEAEYGRITRVDFKFNVTNKIPDKKEEILEYSAGTYPVHYN